MNKNVRQIALYLLIIAALAFFVATFSSQSGKPVELTYTQFTDALAAGRAPSPSLRESRQSVEIAQRIREALTDEFT